MRSVVLALLCTIAWVRPATAGDETDGPMLRAGDRVVFYGDSITEQRLYTRYVQAHVYLRHPDLDVRFYNAGWGGDTVPGALGRLERDVLSLRPTVVTLCFGMNDGGYRPPDDGVRDAYRSRLTELVTALEAAHVRVLVCTPGCVDPDRNPGLGTARYNDALEGLAKTALEVARARGCRGVDLHHPMLAHQTARKAVDKAFTMIPDGVHPDAEGHAVMAREILRALGVASAPAWPAIDVAAPAAKAPAGVRTTRDGDDLVVAIAGPVPVPLWMDGGAATALAAAPTTAPWASRLALAGLDDGAYEVTVGAATLGTWPAEALAHGVAVPGTWSEQGRRVHDLVERKEQQYFDTWRQLRLPYAGTEGLDALVAARMAADDAMHAMLRALVVPTESVELRVARAPGGENLALRKPYEASDPNRYQWGLGGLTDGSWDPSAAHCFATGDGAKLPKSVTVDLGTPRKFASVRFGVPPFGSTKTVVVSTSKDGKRFDDVGRHEFAQGKGVRLSLGFPPTTARFVRLTYVDRHETVVQFPATFAFTTELEVYAAR